MVPCNPLEAAHTESSQHLYCRPFMPHAQRVRDAGTRLCAAVFYRTSVRYLVLVICRMSVNYCLPEMNVLFGSLVLT